MNVDIKKNYLHKTRRWLRGLGIPIYTTHIIIACCIFLFIMCVSLYVIAYGLKQKSIRAEAGLREAMRLADELTRRESEFAGQIEYERNRVIEIGNELTNAYEEKIRYFEEKTAEFSQRLGELEAIKDDLTYKISSTITTEGEVLSAAYEEEAVGGPAQGDYLDWMYAKLEADIESQEQNYNSMFEYVYSSSLNETGLRFALANGVRRENIPTIWPVSGRITSWYGTRDNPFGGGGREGHNGIDIAVSTGMPVMASGGGLVKFAGMMGSYGYLVIIDHGGGLESYYGHNSALSVKQGQQVRRGQVISLSGNTGRSTGPHVHFEIRFNNTQRNPLDFVNA